MNGTESPVGNHRPWGSRMRSAKKLEQQLNDSSDCRYRVYVGLRHWHPFINETYAQLLKESPEQIIGMCMAPQQSSLSTGAYRKKVEEARAEVGIVPA